jgi:pheromone shutdown protein TraB
MSTEAENQPQTSSVSSTDSKPSVNTISVLDAPLNGKVYLVGTAHFSLESQREVIELIRKVQPHRVVLELCPARTNILKLDEETLLRESREMDTEKILKLMREVKILIRLKQKGNF